MTDLMELLPLYYRGCAPMEDLQQALSTQVDGIWSAREDAFRQLDLAQATWGLDLWEEAYGLPNRRDLSDEERRERIRAKMRGAETATREMLERLAAGFENSGVTLTEYPREYRFTLDFRSGKGKPVPTGALRAAIEEAKPAHLAWDLRLSLVQDTLPAKVPAAAVSVTWVTHRHHPNGYLPKDPQRVPLVFAVGLGCRIHHVHSPREAAG